MEESDVRRAWLESLLKKMADDTVYLTRNHYDGGYEVRIGTVDFFVNDDVIDTEDEAAVRTLLEKYSL